MEITLSLIGMALIVLSWIVQIGFNLKGYKAMRPCFGGLQFVGIAFLVVDSFQVLGQMSTIAWMNVASAVGAFIMAVLALRK